MTEPNTAPDAPNHPTLTAKKSGGRFVWPMVWLVLLCGTIASAAVYLEHRLSQFAAAIVAEQTSSTAPIHAVTQTLDQTLAQQDNFAKQLRALTSSLDDHNAALKILQETEATEKSSAVTDALASDIATLKTRITNLEALLEEQRTHTGAYALTLRDLAVLDRKIASADANALLASITKQLEAVEITPETLPTRARIASNIEALEHLTSSGKLRAKEALFDELMQRLREDSTTQTPAKKPEVTEDKSGFWGRISAHVAEHVRIRPDAQAQLEDATEALRQAAQEGRLHDAVRLIGKLQAAPETLTQWHNNARLRVRAETLLRNIQRDISTLASEA